MIVLTAAEANQVRGLTIRGHALAPVPLTDGAYVLPEECLADIAHARHRSTLGALARRSVTAGEYLHSKALEGEPSTLTPPEAVRLAACQYGFRWVAGEAVVVR